MVSGSNCNPGLNSHPISILIPTLNRTSVLWDTLRALLPQMGSGDELLIVDQNAPPLKLPADLEAPVKHLILSPPSLTQARNHAIKMARNSLLLFLDDDIRPVPDLLEHHREAAALYPGCIIAGAVDQEDTPPTEGVGFVDLRSGESRTNYSGHQEMEAPFFPGGHVLLPKSTLPPKAPFNPRFLGAAEKEEIDYAYRARKRGVSIRFYPKARIYHLKSPQGGCRSPEYLDRFFFHKCHNEALFFGAHGYWYRPFPFLKRMGWMVEFYTRKPAGAGHDTLKVLRAASAILRGGLAGMTSRIAK